MEMVGCEKCDALSAKSGRIGGVFLVGTRDDGTVGEKHRRSDVEMRVRSVGIVGGLLGLFNEELLRGGERANADFAEKCFHRDKRVEW